LSLDFWKFWAGQMISNLGSSFEYYGYSVVAPRTLACASVPPMTLERTLCEDRRVLREVVAE
jgi:hypothetical protein